MTRANLGLILALLFSSFVATAQDTPRSAGPVRRDYHPVGTAEIIVDQSAVTLVVRGKLPDGCTNRTIINMELSGLAFFIDLYRELPFNVECTAVIQPYEERIDISNLFPNPTGGSLVSILLINDRLYGIQYAEESTQPSLSGEWIRGDLPYRTIDIRRNSDEGMEITLQGTLDNTCTIPAARAVPDWQNEGFVMVKALSATPSDGMCVGSDVAFELKVRSAEFSSLAVNGVSIPFDPSISVNLQSFREESVVVTNAMARRVEGILPNFRILVSGITDGCDAPVQIVPQRPEDTRILVKVVRVLLLDTACPEIAREFDLDFYYSPPLNATKPVTLFIGGFEITIAPLR